MACNRGKDGMPMLTIAHDSSRFAGDLVFLCRSFCAFKDLRGTCAHLLMLGVLTCALRQNLGGKTLASPDVQKNAELGSWDPSATWEPSNREASGRTFCLGTRSSTCPRTLRTLPSRIKDLRRNSCWDQCKQWPWTRKDENGNGSG